MRLVLSPGAPGIALPSAERAAELLCSCRHDATSGDVYSSFRVGVLLFSALSALSGQAVHPPPEVPASLSTVPVPQPPPSKLANYVKNQSALAVCGKSKNPDGILSAFDVVGQLFGRDGVIFPACGALWLVRRAVSGSPDTLLLRVMRLELPGPAVCACARDYRQRPQR